MMYFNCLGGAAPKRGVWWLLATSLLFECGSPPGNGPSSARRDGNDVLGSRADIIAEADRLSAAAARQRGEEGLSSIKHAAVLRERMWRLEGRTVDGLEAVDLWSEAGSRGDCLSGIRSRTLQAELVGGDIGAHTREFSPSIAAPRDPECSSLARQALFVMAAEERPTTPVEAAATASPATKPGDWTSPLSLDKRTARVLSVQRYGSKDSARIVIALSEAAAFRVGMLKADDAGASRRLYVDIDRALVGEQLNYEVGGLVQRVRTAQRSDAVRVVLDIEEAAEHRVFYVPEPFRLVIDVARGSTMLKLSSRGPRVVERIVIDPGHGGHDPGAIGPRGLREKDVTLDIAHRAGPLIARELGVSTLLTRDTDAFVSLDERTARANAFGADLFVSIHCNAAERTGSDGIMTFVLDRSSDAAASQVAALENAASDAAAKELATSLGQTQDDGLLTRSLHFAELLQRAAAASLGPLYGPIQDQGVRRAGFYVLAGAHMPAVLFEVSFISNPNGEVRLNTGDYRQKLADSLVNSVRAYRDGR